MFKLAFNFKNLLSIETVGAWQVDFPLQFLRGLISEIVLVLSDPPSKSHMGPRVAETGYITELLCEVMWEYRK